MCFDPIYLSLSASLPSISFGLPIGPPLIFLCLFLCLCDLMSLVTVDCMNVWVAGAFFPELWIFALYHRRSLIPPQPPPPAVGFSRRGEVSRVPPCSMVDCWCDAVLCKSWTDNPGCASLCVQVPHSTTSHPFPFVKFICFCTCCFVNACAPLACSAPGGQKRASALLGLELQVVGRGHVSQGNELGSLEEQPMLSTAEPSIQPLALLFFLHPVCDVPWAMKVGIDVHLGTGTRPSLVLSTYQLWVSILSLARYRSNFSGQSWQQRQSTGRRQVGVQVCLANETGSSPLSSLLYAVSSDRRWWSDAGVLCPANTFLVQARQSPGLSLKESPGPSKADGWRALELPQKAQLERPPVHS